MTERVLRVRAAMPADPLPRPRGWAIGSAGIVLLMIYFAIITIIDAREPSGYYTRHRAGPWPYPTEAVVTWLSAMALEGFAICLVLRWRVAAPLPRRAVALAVVMFLVLLALSPLAMHAGSPVAEHFGWMIFAVIWLVGFAIVGGLVNIVVNARARRVVNGVRARRARGAPGGAA
jgi:hypothetical protein